MIRRRRNDEELQRLRVERTELIKLCLYARDRLTSEAAASKVDDGLAALGVEAVRPDGEPFDPAAHHAVATVETDDPDLHDTVAATEEAGYVDRGTVIREPGVAVYRATEPS